MQLVKVPPQSRLSDVLGPGLITGASDDDPSGIATYSQVGAQFGYGLGWTLLLTYPLMCAIQLISANVGRATGRGVAGNLRQHYPAAVLFAAVGLLSIANVINIAADLGAMAAALQLLAGGPALVYVVGFGILTVGLETFVRYSRYVSVLKWLTLSLFAYVATLFVVRIPWPHVALALLVPHIVLSKAYLVGIVAVFGTTISPYLFFWQSQQEVEDVLERPEARALIAAPEQAPVELKRIRLDTYVGMGFSNLIALCIVVTAAATLGTHGRNDIATSSQAAGALRPIAGQFAFAVFALGIIGTGLLSLPVLAGSVAYALGEASQWPVGLARRPLHARAFYTTIAAATGLGGILNFTRLDPVKALFWSAVVNGVAAVPIMVLIMLVATRKDVMGAFVLSARLRFMGWLATAVMAIAATAMFSTM